MRPLFVRLGAALIYLFIAALIYLAGIHVAPIFYFLYLLVLLVPLAAVAQIVVTLIGLRYYQDFDTEHPVKGQGIGYRLTVANEIFLATCVVRVRFKLIHPDLDSSLQDLQLSFAGRGSFQKNYRISCPYRGIYTVGLESLELRDLIGWLRFRRPVYHRTFYVYPRIIELEPAFGVSRSYGLKKLSRAGRESDFALIEGLEEYRSGMPVKHIAWKKFVGTGHPYLKSYGKSAEPGITLYLDLRRNEQPEAHELEAEDCSIEIAVALVKYFLDNRIPVVAKAMGTTLHHFSGSDAEAFDLYYRDTINLIFQKTISPTVLYHADRRATGSGGSVLFITHHLDAEMLELIETGETGSVGAIVNQTALTAKEKQRLAARREHMAEAGGTLFVVDGPETIREDLQA